MEVASIGFWGFFSKYSKDHTGAILASTPASTLVCFGPHFRPRWRWRVMFYADDNHQEAKQHE